MKIRLSMIVLLLVFAVSCAQPGSSPTAPASAGGSLVASQSSPLEATMRFGNDSVGLAFPTLSGTISPVTRVTISFRARWSSTAVAP